MTKADIIEQLHDTMDSCSKQESAELFEMVLDTIKDVLESGEKLKISKFGNFVVRDKKARVGRNPQTGVEAVISARKVLTFKPGQVLKSKLNINSQ